MIEQFHFLRPGWLLLLIPLALILWLLLRARYDSGSWRAVIDERLLPFVLSGDDRKRRGWMRWTFGAVAMVVQRDSGNGHACGAGIVLDVHRGKCRTARFIEEECDPQDAEFVIVGSYARWRDVIEGRLDPIKGMMEGKLKLARGHLPTIIRFVESARQLVVSASRVPTLFDE